MTQKRNYRAECKAVLTAQKGKRSLIMKGKNKNQNEIPCFLLPLPATFWHRFLMTRSFFFSCHISTHQSASRVLNVYLSRCTNDSKLLYHFDFSALLPYGRRTNANRSLEARKSPRTGNQQKFTSKRKISEKTFLETTRNQKKAKKKNYTHKIIYFLSTIYAIFDICSLVILFILT